jgi:hypothetical protein
VRCSSCERCLHTRALCAGYSSTTCSIGPGRSETIKTAEENVVIATLARKGRVPSSFQLTRMGAARFSETNIPTRQSGIPGYTSP